MMAPNSPAAVQTNRNTSVYINCPFDPDYRPIFDALVFAIVCSGYTPRSALETHTACEPRMTRIAKAMHDSKYSIHDLCRCKGAGDENLARFNMPFELGISVAMRFSESQPREAHDWLVLVPDGEAYQQFISDLAGYDLVRYPEAAPNAREKVMAAIVNWLITRHDATGAYVAPKDVIDVLPEFEAARMALDKRFCDTTPWPFLVQAAERVARERLPTKIR